MTPDTTPSATWDSWTVEQRTEWLATVIMRWFRVKARGRGAGVFIWATQDRDQNHHWDFAEEIDWNPLSSWDDWRRVEERVMEDEELWEKFADRFPGDFPIDTYMRADLPTRAKALYLAYRQLHDA